MWDKQHGVDVERRRLLERTRELVARGLGAGNLWHSASHAEHARPMLQVCLLRVPNSGQEFQLRYGTTSLQACGLFVPSHCRYHCQDLCRPGYA